jgi:ABC-type multidrug transport system fused ATPase/permease subunit
MSAKMKQQADADADEKAHISLKAIWYVMKVYRKAAGKRRFLVTFNNLYDSVMPSVTAVLGGTALTQIVEAVETHNLVPFLFTILILAGLQFFGILLGRYVSLLEMEIRNDVYIKVTEMISLKYIEIPLAERESKEFSDKFERVIDFGNNVYSVISSVSNIGYSVISLITILVTTIATSWIITLIIIVSSIPYSVLSLKLSMRQRSNWRKHTSDYRKAFDIRNKIIHSNSSLEIEVNGLAKHFVNKMVKLRQEAARQDILDYRKYFWPSNWMRLIETVMSFFSLTFVALKIVAGEMAIGRFTTVRNLLQQLSSSITSLFYGIANANEGIVNATDYMEFMNTPAPANGRIKVKQTPKIEFRNVSFTYPHATEKAIDNVSFVLEPGESLAIVGENGAGKTTLIKLLIGAYQPQDGMIFVNDEPLEKIDRNSYLEQIGALFQDFSRYEFATLGENVWYGDITKRLDKSRVRAALAKAGLEDFDKNFANGLDQLLSKNYDKDNATDLSGGQWQRLSIARAFYREANVLLLDEPTSAVDAKAEYEIFKNILEHQKNRTTVIISHRFSTVRKAEQIMVVDHGKIIERGTHQELIEKDGLYKEMFDLQAEGYVN